MRHTADGIDELTPPQLEYAHGHEHIHQVVAWSYIVKHLTHLLRLGALVAGKRVDLLTLWVVHVLWIRNVYMERLLLVNINLNVGTCRGMSAHQAWQLRLAAENGHATACPYRNRVYSAKI